MAAEYCCARCRTPFLNAHPLDEEGVCALCRQGLRGFDAAFSYGFHDGPLRTLIHLFKYDGVQSLAGPLGGLLLKALPRDKSYHAIVPMPMHWLRRWERGFNQTDLLAKEVSRRIALPVARAMARARSTAPQAGKSSSERRRNVAGAFRVRQPRQVAGKNILLLDDVLTTGATAAAAANVLKRAGARGVTLLTVSRADRRPVAVDEFIRSGESLTHV
jgi:ComF family protein